MLDVSGEAGSILQLTAFDNVLRQLNVPIFTALTTSYSDPKALRKQPPRGVLRKRPSENIQEFYRTTPMAKCRTLDVGVLL